MLTGRLCTFLFSVASAVLVWLACYRINKNVTVSSGAVVVFSFSPFLAGISGESSNYMMPMALSLLAFFLFMGVISDGRFKRSRMFLVGLSLALATGTKLYYGPLSLAFLLLPLVYPKTWPLRRRLSQLVTPMFAGMFLGFIPVVYYFANAPDAFVFNNLGYHLVNSQWSGFYLGGNFGYRIEQLFRTFLIYPANLAFALLTFYVFFRAVYSNRRVEMIPFANDQVIVLTAVLSSLGLVVAVVPLPAFVYFYAAPFPFMIILVVALLHRIPRPEWSGKDGLVLYLVMLVTTISGASNLYQVLPDFVNSNKWTGIKVHNTSEDIRRSLEPIRQGDLIATLSPLYAIEARLPIYVQFASGPFFYRVGDLLFTQKLEHFQGTSPNRVIEMLERQPPIAVIVGVEGVLDAPLLAYAEEKQFLKLEVGLVQVYKNTLPMMAVSRIRQ